MNKDWKSNANSKRALSQKKHRVILASNLEMFNEVTKEETTRETHRIAQTSREKPVESLLEVRAAVHQEEWYAYFFRTIEKAWSAYTSGGPTAMPTEATVDIHAATIVCGGSFHKTRGALG